MLAFLLLLLTLLPPQHAAVAPAPPPAATSSLPSFQSSNSYATANFLVEAPDAATARQVALWAERAHDDIHRRWFSQDGPRPPGERGRGEGFSRPVLISVLRDHPGYYSTRIEPDGVVTITVWAGDAELESTVRHEVWHAVVHLRYPGQHIPRWLDEGLAICNESKTEQARQLAPLFETDRRFTVRELAEMRDYPRDIALFYAQGYSLADHLVRRHGERQVIRFLEASFRAGQEEALRQVLGYGSWEELEREWLGQCQGINGLDEYGRPLNGNGSHVFPLTRYSSPRSQWYRLANL